MTRAQSPCEWTERWRTPLDRHIAPQGGHKGPAGACETSHYTDGLQRERQTPASA